MNTTRKATVLPQPPLAAVVLAAGASQRMGRYKPLLDLGGCSVLARVVALLRGHGVNQVVVVTGHRAPELEPVARALGAWPVYNPRHAEGMFTSLLAGMAALPTEANAFFLLPVDIPLVRGHTLERLKSARTGQEHKALLPSFQGEPGHPPLIPTSLAPAIAAYEGPGGLRGFWEAHPELVASVPVADRFILRDLDHPEDYEAMLADLPGRPVPSPAECLALLQDVAGHGPDLVAHCQAVGSVALALARLVNAHGGRLDPDLALAGGLLHDVAKGAPDHPAAGAALLRDMGFALVAPLAAGHTDLEVSELAPLNEAELVHLADKLVQGAGRIALNQRFADKLARHGSDPQARAAIERRQALAGRIAHKVEQAVGADLESALAGLDLTGREWQR